MLNYAGPTIGQGPVTASLPPAMPGTMPQGVPGVSPSPAPLPPMAIHPHGQGAPLPPSIMAAIQSQPGPGPDAAPPGPPPPPDYGTTTQEDGSILLHVKNPDGTLGPIVKIIPPIKRSGAQ